MSIANLFRLGRLWIEHFGQLTKEDITINVICERNDFDRRSNSRQNRYIYIYICEASCVSHVLCVRIIVEGTCTYVMHKIIE